MTREFPYEFINDVRWASDGGVVSDRIVDHARWSVWREMVFLHEGTYYMVCYEVPATECQEVYEPETVTATVVHPVEKKVVVYEPVS